MYAGYEETWEETTRYATDGALVRTWRRTVRFLTEREAQRMAPKPPPPSIFDVFRPKVRVR